MQGVGGWTYVRAAMAMAMDPGREGARGPEGRTDNRPVLIIERRIDGGVTVAWVNNAESSGNGNNNSGQRGVGGERDEGCAIGRTRCFFATVAQNRSSLRSFVPAVA